MRMGAEGLAQYLETRRRLKLGLCEAMACDRFLLWGIAGSLRVILEAIVTANDFGLTCRLVAHECGALPGGRLKEFPLSSDCV
jgi:hypothetical protein